MEGIQPSIGTVGDAYDKALAEITIGRYKTECVRAGSPFQASSPGLSDFEDATSAWISWDNSDWLMRRLDRRPPAEHEADYYPRNQ